MKYLIKRTSLFLILIVCSICPNVTYGQTKLFIESSSNRMAPGDTMNIDAFIEKDGIKSQIHYPDISWHSTFPSVAGVDANGVVTASRTGNTKIYARLGGTGSASATVTSELLSIAIISDKQAEPKKEGPRLQPELGSDSDGDGLSDHIEEKIGSNPKKIDTDGDGINDYMEVIQGTSPRNRGLLFEDLEKIAWAKPYIIRLTQYGVIKGFEDGSFKPSAQITRAELVKIILEASGVRIDSYQSAGVLPFSDVPRSSWQYRYVQYAYDTKLISGYADGTFKPNRPVTRREAMKIILEAIGIGKGDQTVSRFSDVKTAWAIPYIEKAHQLGLVGGYEDGSFKPDAYISRAEASKIIGGLL